MKANRFWWREQNKSLKQDCQRTSGCWRPRDHQGECQPVYERGDYVKVEFPDETTGVGEWMWMIVDHCEERKVAGLWKGSTTKPHRRTRSRVRIHSDHGRQDYREELQGYNQQHEHTERWPAITMDCVRLRG